MEVKIGVQYASRELVVETDESAEAVEKLVADALTGDGSWAFWTSLAVACLCALMELVALIAYAVSLGTKAARP